MLSGVGCWSKGQSCNRSKRRRKKKKKALSMFAITNAQVTLDKVYNNTIAEFHWREDFCFSLRLTLTKCFCIHIFNSIINTFFLSPLKPIISIFAFIHNTFNHHSLFLRLRLECGICSSPSSLLSSSRRQKRNNPGLEDAVAASPHCTKEEG